LAKGNQRIDAASENRWLSSSLVWRIVRVDEGGELTRKGLIGEVNEGGGMMREERQTPRTYTTSIPRSSPTLDGFVSAPWKKFPES